MVDSISRGDRLFGDPQSWVSDLEAQVGSDVMARVGFLFDTGPVTPVPDQEHRNSPRPRRKVGANTVPVFDRLHRAGARYLSRATSERKKKEDRESTHVKTLFQSAKSKTINSRGTKDFFARVESHEQKKVKARLALLEKKEREEVAECTHKPAKDNKPRKVSNRKENLVDNTQKWVSQRLSRPSREAILTEREIQVAAECTFQPSTNRSSIRAASGFMDRLKDYTESWHLREKKALEYRAKNYDEPFQPTVSTCSSQVVAPRQNVFEELYYDVPRDTKTKVRLKKQVVRVTQGQFEELTNIAELFGVK